MLLAVPVIVKIASVPEQTGSLEVNDVIAGLGDIVTVVEFVNIDEQLLPLMLFSLIEVFPKIPEIVMIFLPAASKITVGFVSPPSVV